MRGKERELIVLRSENGDTWKEHQSDARPEDLFDLLTGMDEGRGKVILICDWLTLINVSLYKDGL